LESGKKKQFMKNPTFVPEIVLSLKGGYGRQALVKDIISGIIVGIIALPLSLALAIASGAPPETGLITAVFAGAAAGILGGSRVQISGPTGAFVVIVYGIIAEHGMGGLVLATFSAGILITIMGFMKLGRFIKYIPLPVITGFTAGIAATIFIGQLKDFLGLGIEHNPSETLLKFVAVAKNLSSVSGVSLLMGLFALSIIYILPRIQKILPGPLAAIIICTAINFLLPVRCRTLGDVYGAVNVKIAPSLAFFDFSDFGGLIMPTVTIALLASIESLLSAVVADSMTGTKHNPNMELVGQGAANMLSAVFGGLPATGAIARTSANIRSGGSSPIASLTHAAVVLILSVFLMRFAVYIPMAVFSSILIVVSYNMFNYKEVLNVFKTTPVDIVLMILTFVLTLAFDLVVAILTCTFLSLAYRLVMRFAAKKDAKKTDSEGTTKIKGTLSYINYEKIFAAALNSKISLDMSEVEEVDATVIGYLEGKARRRELKIVAASPKVKKQLARHSEFAEIIK